jgi:hypothetical protein
MSGLGLWNLNKGPNKVERPDMSRLGLWNPDKTQRPDMSRLAGDFGGKIDFDVLHFTNSPDVSPLIVRSY